MSVQQSSTGVCSAEIVHSEENQELKFLTTCPLLPAELPAGWPRIIDLSLKRPIPETTSLVNGIPTVLHYYDASFLAKFLDLAIEKVTFIAQYKRNSSCRIIERNRFTITVRRAQIFN